MIDKVAVEERERFSPLGSNEDRALRVLVAWAVVGTDGVIRSASDRWCDLVRRPRVDVVDERWEEVLGEGVSDVDLRTLPADGAAVQTVDVRLPAPGGRHRPLRVAMTPLSDVDPPSWMLVAEGPDEEQLEEHRQRLLQIFDNSADAVTIVGSDGAWRVVTSGGRNLLGLPDDDLHPGGPEAPSALDSAGAPVSDHHRYRERICRDAIGAVHPDDRATVRQAIADLAAHPDDAFGRRFECRVRTADGKWLWLETRGVNVIEVPLLEGILLHSRDVTDSHEAAEEVRSMASRLRSLVDNLFTGVIMSDDLDKLIFANRAASQMFGLGDDPDRLTRMSGGMLTAHLQRLHRDHHALERIAQIVAERRLVKEERVELTTERILARSFVPITDDGVYRGHLWLLRDLTDELAVATEREHLFEMEQEQNARLTELDSLKSDLVAQVSHELRTPLTSIVSFTHLLRDALSADNTDDQVEFLDIITRNTDRLLRLVDDLLLLDRLESNSLQVSNEWVDFPSLVDIAVSSIRPAAGEKKLVLVSTTEAGPPLVGDVDRLGQLVDNLLANAVKFTPAGGRVRIEVARTPDGWRLTVDDTGIGIPAEEQRELFQRFYRASNARKASVSGSGLGLLIALRITELHRGTIRVESVEGEGTTVTVELRGAAAPPPPSFVEIGS